MKKRITAILVLLCLMAAFLPSAVGAPGSVYFIAVNYILEPLSNDTMPATIGGLLYVPSGIFSYDQLGINYAVGGNEVYLYSGKKSLRFDTVRATVFDQDDNQYYIPAQNQNGLIYLPVDFVCKFFGLDYRPIQSDPAPVLLINSSSITISSSGFLDIYRKRMQEYYNAYMNPSVSPGTSASPGVTTGPSPSPTPTQTFEGVTVYLSFNALSVNNFDTVLSAVDAYGYKCCFFLSADEIDADADLIRRAAGKGHSIGIWLKEGTFEEYQSASDLLFEACKLRTILVSTGADTEKAAGTMASEKGLDCWKPARTFDEASTTTFPDFTGTLSVIAGSRDSAAFACTDKTIYMISAFLEYLTEKRYSVGRITEVTAPTSPVG